MLHVGKRNLEKRSLFTKHDAREGHAGREGIKLSVRALHLFLIWLVFAVDIARRYNLDLAVLTSLSLGEYGKASV